MNLVAYAQMVAALAVVIALILGLAWLARRGGLGGGLPGMRGAGRRLGVIEVAAVDAKRRLVLLRRDDREHLVLLGPTQDLLIEAGIDKPRFVVHPPEPDPMVPSAVAAPAPEATP